MHQVSFRKRNSTPDDEIVEDSEPEREESREREKEKRRARRANRERESPNTNNVVEPGIIRPTVDSSVKVVRHPPFKPPERSIIVISDDSDSYTPIIRQDAAHQRGTDKPRTVDIPDSSFEGPSSTLPSIRQILGLPPRPRARPAAQDALQVYDIPASQGSAEPPPPTQSTISTVSPLSQRDGPVQGVTTVSEGPESGSDSGDEVASQILKLAKYAYVDPSRSSSRASFASTSSSRAPSVARAVSVASAIAPNDPAATTPLPPRDEIESLAPPKGKPGRKPKPRARYLTVFSDVQLNRLLRCVSCNLAWTTRKTVLQKMKHVQACARKTGLSDDAVEGLIREELEKPLPPPKGKPNVRTLEQEEQDRRTLLEKAVQEGDKQRRRRAQIEGTVRDLKDTREGILERARALLVASKPAAEARNESTNNVDSGDEKPPLTQPFGRSNLAQRFRGARTVIQLEPSQIYHPSEDRIVPACRPASVERDEDEGPPRTQPFGASGLAARFGARPVAADAVADERSHSPAYLLDEDAVEDEPALYALSEDEKDLGMASVPKTARSRRTPSNPASPAGSSSNALNRRSPSLVDPMESSPSVLIASSSVDEAGRGRTTVHQFESLGDALWQDQRAGEEDVFMSDNAPCDAILQYDPELEASPTYTPEQSIPVRPVQKSKRTKKAKEQEATSSESEALATKGKTKADKKTKKAKKPKAVVLTKDEIDARLNTLILGDIELYHRILRYEPIPFDEFLNLVAGEDSGIKATGPLKLQVRAYLDKQAIQFYGFNGFSRSRRKRSRRPG